MADYIETVSSHKNEKSSAAHVVQNGCRVSFGMAIAFGLLVIAIATGVGLLVHFAGGPRRNVTCHCGKDQGSATSVEQFWRQCQQEVKDKKMCLSSKCADQTSTTMPPSSTSGTEVPEVTENFRLPTSLHPINYDLELKPNIYGSKATNFTFDGRVIILINCTDVTSNITLHVNQITINNQSILVKREFPESSDIPVKDYSIDLARQFLVFHLDERLTPVSQYSLSFNFTGPMKNDLKGLYTSSYKRDNRTVYMAVSMFAPTDARKSFPCFDEPALKATFNVVIVRKPHMISLSNMPVIRNESRPEGFVADIFNTTEKMSTYLLAFVVCDFSYKAKTSLGGTLVRVWSRPEAVGQVDLALETGVKVLDYYEEYFQIKYPLPKQDMIAIPDFLIGGMENWGLITYRESYLLSDTSSASDGDRQHTVSIVAHELAHQWFGNLVTPAWWDDIWLNEGFASFVEYLGGNDAFPNWNMFGQFIRSDLYRAFDQDGLVTSHPIYQPVSEPDDINANFDSITYAKGASVLRMLRYVLGEEPFRKGLSDYLRNLAYQAAFHDDLYGFLKEQSELEGNGLDVKSFMDTWTLQMNFPVVHVNRTSENVIQLRQERFLISGTNVTKDTVSPFGYKWEIPFTYTSSVERDFNHSRIHFMSKSGSQVFIEDSTLPALDSPDGWIIGNAQQYGYYRVNYDQSNWDAIIRQLKSDYKVIHASNRAQIINDAFNLVRASLLNQMTALRVVEYLKAEEDYVPWMVAVDELKTVNLMLSQSRNYGDFQKFMVRTVSPLYQKLGRNTTSGHLNSLLRSSVVDLACEYDLSDCVQTAKTLFNLWRASPTNNPIESMPAQTVYCTVIRHGNQADWDFAYQAYKQSNVATEKGELLSALACSKDVWILGRYLEWSLEPEEIRSQDTTSVIIAIAANPVGRYLAWRFLQLHWDELRERYGSGLFSFARLILGVTIGFNTELDGTELEEFMVSHPDQGTATRAFQQALQRTRSNIDWMQTNEQVVADWLKSYLNS